MECPSCGSALATGARFCSQCGAPQQPEAPRGFERSEPPGEHRLVTLLFADMSRSVARTEGMEPEQAATLVEQLLSAMVEVVDRYGGRVDRFLGDGVLAVFGAPRAREDDAERGVRAALDIGDRAATLGLAVTAGLNTGEVYFGTIGGTSHREVTVMGPTVNLAARLQGEASEGEVILGPATARLVQGLFDLAPRTVEVKGLAEPVRAHRVEGVREAGARARGVAGLRAPLVGREQELGALRRVVEEAGGGAGRLVLLSGEAGVGKTRLVTELREAGAGRGGEWLEGRSSELTQESAYAVFADLLRRRIGLSRALAPDEAAARLESFLAALDAGRAADALPFLATVVGVDRDDWRQRIESTVPEQRSGRVADAVGTVLHALSVRGPTLAVLEDLHWADPLSVELAGRLAHRLADVPLVVLATVRPEWDAGALLNEVDRDSVLEVHLDELGHDDAVRLLSELVGPGVVPDALVASVLDRARGNPFFVEELVRSLIEQGVLRRTGAGWEAAGGVASPAVPDSVRAVIASRVDRLDRAAVRVAEVAAAVGASFSPSLLTRIAPDADLERCLTSMAEAQLAHPEADGEEGEWSFSHALVRESIYQGVLPSRRLPLHEAIARALEPDLTSPSDDLVDTVAYQYDRSENHVKAVEFLSLAAERAAGAHLNAEALRHLERALARLAEIPAPEQAERRAALLELRGDLLARVGRLVDAQGVYLEALDSLPGGRDGDAGRLHRKTAASQFWAPDRDNADVEQHLERAAVLLERAGAGHRGDWIDLQLARGNYLYLENRVDEMLALVDEVEPVVRREASAVRRFEFLGVRAMADLRAHRMVVPDASIDLRHEMLALARGLGDPGRIAAAHFTLGFAHLWRTELDEAVEQLLEGAARAEQVGDGLLRAQTLVYLATARRRQGDREATVEATHAALERAREMESRHYAGICLGHLAWVAWVDGDLEEARRLGDEAVARWGPDAFPLRWTALWPLIAVAAATGDLARARELLPELRRPWELRMPDDLEAACVAAEQAADADAPRLLDQALDLAHRDRFL